MLASRHHDGEVNAIAAERLGVGTIRGSGNHGSGFIHKGGVAAFQAMLDALKEGNSVALSADVPKVARVAGLGIIKLAQISGRPIYPIAIATQPAHRPRQLGSHHHQSAVHPRRRDTPEPLRVAADADAAALEAARSLLEERLNAATQRAYEIVDKPQSTRALGRVACRIACRLHCAFTSSRRSPRRRWRRSDCWRAGSIAARKIRRGLASAAAKQASRARTGR